MRWILLEHKLALAILLIERRLVRGQRTGPAIDALLEAGWVGQTRRRSEVALTAAGEVEVRALLERSWPTWQATVAAMVQAGLPLTPEGLAAWERTQTLEAAPRLELPARLNQKTLAARFNRHSKAGSIDQLLLRFPQLQITTDDVLRLRTPTGLNFLRSEGRRLACDDLMALSGEVMLSERALLDGTRLEGPLTAVLTVENPGAFVDLTPPVGWLVILVPGWNSSLALRLLATLPIDVPIVHFGDLDPEGLEIVRHLRRSLARPVAWCVPAFWGEYLEGFGRPLSAEQSWDRREDRGWDRGWAEASEAEAPLPPLVKTLMETRRWLEQEVLVLDPRLSEALEGMMKARDYDDGGRGR